MSEMTVGSIRTTVNPPSGIYEALLEKAERERDEAREDAANLRRMSVVELMSENLNVKHHVTEWENRCLKAERERDEAREESLEQACLADNVYAELLEAREESLEQARLLGGGGSREARLITERDHYKTSLESLLKSIDDWNDSMVKEPADDFIAAIAAYITEKLEK